ncbi:peptide deformylase [Parendozoicomonas haliclonae]|uniref:Peptide deformylase n=1 Tax=Parendozoicomonas haliclonae TaxID=1960125 RepID=A0A1X7AG41_9GAMM|nr:peptide deformylase [Parendozoicomonas haliclonae]SMA32047.1 Peptide deformylase [Parendozoicomonas haliclonae]
MAERAMVYEPDSILRKKADPVSDFGDEFQQLVDDMFETMYANKGCGLAAPQIGIGLQVSVIDLGEEPANPFVIVNPEIIERTGIHNMEAGCLSVPGAFAAVERSATVRVKAQDRFGKPFEIGGDGLLAECLQHEIDHLNGVLFIDHLQPVKKQMVQNKSRKFRRKNKLG